jgi:hypothetical protein
VQAHGSERLRQSYLKIAPNRLIAAKEDIG